jgi:hypothetical protein
MTVIVRFLVGGCLLTGAFAASAQYLESDGDVAMEAEHYSNYHTPTSHQWLTVCDSTVLNMPGYASGPSGEGAMYAFPDAGTITGGRSPELRYAVEFTDPGVYNIWIRAHSPTEGSNAIRIGLDDDQTGAGEIYRNVPLPTGAGYNWTDGSQTLDLSGITPGEVHTIHIWMREDGTFIDMIFLSLNNQTDPRPVLPPETAMNSLPPTAAPVISPAGGGISSSIDVTLTSCTSGADIYWSDDGVTAPFDGGPNGPFTTPLTLTATTTIMAAAFAPATHLDSNVTPADFALVSADNNFTMLDPDGLLAGGATDVSATLNDALICADVSCTQFSMTLDSNQPLSGSNWAAHDIRTFSEGSYTFDTICTGTDIAAGTTDCGGTPLNLTVGPGQLGVHMLFDWNGNNDIDIAGVWNIDDSFGSPIYSASGTADEDPTQTATRVWNLASKDGDGDGIRGIPMVDGPLVGYSANFNLDIEPPFSFLPPATTIEAAVLPASRSVQVGNAATAFGTIVNSGTANATACRIAPSTTVTADFIYQTTNPATNALTGTPNTPVDIVAGGSQSYVFAFTPTAEISSTEVELVFDCSDTDPAPVTVGLNTLLLSASTNPVPDIVALSATQSGDGIVDLPGLTGMDAFAVASANVGIQGTITASADTGTANLPVTVEICQTNPVTGGCLAEPSPSVSTTIDAGATPTFSIFATGSGTVPFDPANNRIFVRFNDAGGVTRGSTSVAVRTVTP